MNRSLVFSFFLFLIFLSVSSAAQESNIHEVHTDVAHEGENEVPHKKHALSASLNHTIIFSGVKNNEEKASIGVPSFGINYNYALSIRWIIGLHNDIIMEDFLVAGGSGESNRSEGGEGEIGVIERGRPVSSALMVTFKPIEKLGIMAGAGREFSKHEDYTVLRFGLESPIHLPHHWEVFGALSYDIMIDAYNSLTYGIGVAKLF
jgi:hypothetical protein